MRPGCPGEYDSALKRKAGLPPAAGSALLRDVSPRQKHQCCLVPLLRGAWRRPTLRDRKQVRGHRGLGEGEGT